MDTRRDDSCLVAIDGVEAVETHRFLCDLANSGSALLRRARDRVRTCLANLGSRGFVALLLGRLPYLDGPPVRPQREQSEVA